MADINEILGRQINSVKELKKAIADLQNSLIGVDADSEQFKTTTAQLAAAQAELNKVTKAGKEDNDAAADSIRGMEQEYKKLYDTYKMLTEEQRNSDFGKNMAESLETLSSKINESKKEVGNFKDNIGRYAGDISDAFNKMGISVGGLQAPLKAATGGAKTFGASLKALAANPIVLVITALVAILAKAIEAIKKNEELTNRLKVAFSAFKPILDAVSNAFDFLAGIIVKVVEGLAKVAEKIMSVIPGMKKAIESHKELAKATNDLTKAQREANVENSKKTAEIERLREEASATDDVIEKKKKLEEAKEIQRQIDEENIRLAQEELRILQEYGEKTANSAEENEKLAAAQAKVNQAIAQGEANMRQYNKQISAASKSTSSSGGSARKKVDEYKKQAEEILKQLEEDNKTEEQKLKEKYDKEFALLEKYHLDTKLLTAKYNEDLKKLNEAEKQKELEAIAKLGEEANKKVAEELKAMRQQFMEEELKALQGGVDQSTYENAVKENARKLLEAEKSAIEEELATFSGNSEQKLAIEQRYYEVVAELRNQDWEAEQAQAEAKKELLEKQAELVELNSQRTWQMINNLIDATDKIGSSIGTIRSSYESLIDSEVKAGKIDEGEAKKKKKRLLNLQKVETAFNIATIAADAASGIFSVWKGYAVEQAANASAGAAAGPAGPAVIAALNAKSLISAIAKTASLAATAAAQIAAARNGMVSAQNNFNAGGEGGGTVSVGATPNLVDETPYSYTKTVQTVEEQDEINNRPIYVTVTDIENGLGQRAQVVDETSF